MLCTHVIHILESHIIHILCTYVIHTYYAWHIYRHDAHFIYICCTHVIHIAYTNHVRVLHIYYIKALYTPRKLGPVFLFFFVFLPHKAKPPNHLTFKKSKAEPPDATQAPDTDHKAKPYAY